MVSLIALALAVAAIIWVVLEVIMPTSAVAHWLHRVVRDYRVHHRAGGADDPFDVLCVQSRLEAVAHQMRSLETDRWCFARRHRLNAARAAYDDLLVEACELAGVDLPPPEARNHDETERWREERELTSRGWSW